MRSVVWQLVDPRYYAGSLGNGSAVPKARDRGFGLHEGDVHGHERSLWYQDTSARETGELVLHTMDGSVTWFQLTHTKWPNGREHVAEWRAGEELHLGEVHEQGSSDGGRAFAASPMVRRYADTPEAILREMTDYFLKHADALHESHREAIAAVLWSAQRKKS